MERWEKSARLLRHSEGCRHRRDGQQTNPWQSGGGGIGAIGFGCLPPAETMSPSSHLALGHWGTAPIPQHVGALLPRSECHRVSVGLGRSWGLPWLPPTPPPTSLPVGTPPWFFPQPHCLQGPQAQNGVSHHPWFRIHCSVHTKPAFTPRAVCFLCAKPLRACTAQPESLTALIRPKSLCPPAFPSLESPFFQILYDLNGLFPCFLKIILSYMYMPNKRLFCFYCFNLIF